MKKLLLSTLVILLVLSCNNKENVSTTETVIPEPQRIADSLQSAADSIASRRQLHSQFSGRHIHAAGSDLAEAAHQNPEQIDRLRTAQRDQAENRRSAAAARSRRMQEVTDSTNASNIDEDSVIVFEEVYPDL